MVFSDSKQRRANPTLALSCLAIGLIMQSNTAQAAPFDTCPSKAYLFQAKPVQVYGVNLVTGQTTLLQGDTGTSNNINGVGFDFDSRYIYGYDTDAKKIVRLGKDFRVEDINTGEVTQIGDTGEKGTFGAGYFDVNGYYYVSRNQDGFIYRVDLSSQENIDNGNVTAVKFAEGPSSSKNDGARCANAPVIDEDSNIDFGDAPETYKTTLAANGPRHAIDGVTYIGDLVPDGEQDGLIAPLSDNTTGINDDDGIGFVTAIEPGLDSIITVNASTQGYLTAWFDWNQDGDFDDEGEHVIQDTLLNAGQNQVIFTVDYGAQTGMTWSRFRFSTQTGLSPYGGALNGEVEDHQITVTGDGITVRHFPSETGYATLAYEDNWPYTADYDMNDVVIHYRVTEILKQGSVKKSYIQGRLAAYGADYHNGFAIRLKGLDRESIDTSITRQLHDQVEQGDSGLELDSNEAIFIVSNDLSHKKGKNCRFYRTQMNCKENESFTFELHITLNDDAETSSLIDMPYDPFIFATPGYYHGEGLPLHPGRSWEVHLADYAPTEKFNGDAMFNLGLDSSDPATGRYFKTPTNLPWALLVTEEWRWPTERVDLVNAYPEFAEYAETSGQQKTNWHKRSRALIEKIYE